MADGQLSLLVVALLALAIGVMIPVLLQVRSTWRTLQDQLRSTGPRIDRLLDETQATVSRLDRFSRGLEGGEVKVAALLEATTELTYTLRKVGDTTRVASAMGAAVVPAIVAGIRAFRDQEQQEQQEHADPPEDGSEQEQTTSTSEPHTSHESSPAAQA